MPNVQVGLLDLAKIIPSIITGITTNAEGKFELVVEEKTLLLSFGNRLPEMYFQVTDGNKIIASTENEMWWSPQLPNQYYTIKVKEEVVSPPPDGGNNTGDVLKVRGLVTNMNAEPLANQSVLLIDIDLRGAAVYKKAISAKALEQDGIEVLGTALTNDKGQYEIKFTAASFAQQEIALPDVVAFVVANDEISGRSALSNKKDWNKDKELENLNIILAQSTQRGISEYSRVMQVIVPFVEKSKLHLYDLYDSQDQIQFLATETEQELLHVAILVEAAKRASEYPTNALSHELLYGLGRQQVSLQFSYLALLKKSSIRAALGKSIADNIIAPHEDKILKYFTDGLSALAGAAILNKTADAMGQAIRQVLGLSLSDTSQQSAFLRAQQEYVGSPEKFWSEYLPALPEFVGDDKAIQGLLLTNQLSALTQNHLPLMEEIQVARGISDPVQLMRLSDADWVDMIGKVGPPASTQLSKEQFATQLQDTLNMAFPTQRIAILTESNAFGLAETTNYSLQNFFSAAPDFDIRKSKIDDYDNLIQSVGNGQGSAVKQELQTLQRLFQISPDIKTLTALKKLDFRSARQISGIPEDSFMTALSGSLGSPEAQAVMFRARHISKMTEQVATMLQREAISLQPAILQTIGLTEVIEKHIPNFQELFGATSICECEHCRSVYGPAAYLVDLLRFLDKSVKNNAAPAQSPYEVLMYRRPDLAYLKLSCENTNTIIPYIDLVNEILEYYVVAGDLDAAAAYDTGDTTAAELRANPQNMQQTAYSEIAKKVYPFTLPYHQPLDVIHTYLDHLGINRATLMEQFKTNNELVTQNTIAAERLGLSEREFEIITTYNFSETFQAETVNTFYGYDTADSFKPLIREVPELLNRTGIRYIDLVEILKTRFINPGQAALSIIESIFIGSGISSDSLYHTLKSIHDGTHTEEPGSAFSTALLAASAWSYTDFSAWVQEHFPQLEALVTLYEEDSACNIGATVLRSLQGLYTPTDGPGSDGADLSDLFLSRLHRFIRLWRKTGWSIHELDLHITASAELDLNPALLRKLAVVQQIRAEVSVPLPQLTTFWGVIDTYGQQSLYRQIFLNKAIRSADETFAIQRDGRVLTQSVPISAHIPALLAAFRLKEDDLTSIASDLGWVDLAQPLTLENVSRLYRYVLLARTLKITVSELITLKNITGKNPFLASDYPATLDFILEVRQIKASKFNLPVLDYLLLGNDRLVQPFSLSSSAIETAIARIKVALPEAATLVAGSPEEAEAISEMIAQIATVVSLDVETTFELLENPGNFVRNIDDLVPELPRLKNAALLINGFELKAKEVAYLKNHRADFADLSLVSPTYAQWKRLFAYTTLRNHLPRENDPLLKVFVAASDPAATLETLNGLLETQIGWNRIALAALQVHYNHNQTILFTNEHVLSLYNEILKKADKTGISVNALVEWSKTPPDFDGLHRLAENVKSIVKAKYDDTAWVGIAAKLNDKIRENQKLALIAYVLTMPGLSHVTDADGLFEHFLIDVQMDACMDTSRIRQALSSVQLFVQRCLLNLETNINDDGLELGVVPPQIVKNRWEWMKNYRVWEANRKIFLYPENWLEPEWRDDKSPFFKELESELLQNDITDASVETAFRNYMHKLDSVSNLDLVGLHQENADQGDAYRLHVFGRTQAQPYQYFYRSYESAYDRWEAWQKVPVDIKGVEAGENSGVHLAPVIWKGRLFLFWVEFMEKTEENSAAMNRTAREGAEQTFAASSPVRYWEIKLAWSEYKDKKWTPKQLSKEAVRTHRSDSIWDLSTYNLKLTPRSASLEIAIIRRLDFYYDPIDRFVLTDINEVIQIQPSLIYGNPPGGLAVHFGHLYNYSRQTKYTSSKLEKINLGSNVSYLRSFKRYKVLYDQNPIEFWSGNDGPFFYMEGNKSYFVVPAAKIEMINIIVRPETMVFVPSGYITDKYATALLPNNPVINPDPAGIYNPGSPVIPLLTNPIRATLYKIPGSGSPDSLRYIANDSYAALPYNLGAAFSGLNWGILPPSAALSALQFKTFFHPHTDSLLERLNRGGIDALLATDTDTAVDLSGNSLYDDEGRIFKERYNPDSEWVSPSYPAENLDFTPAGAYSLYNWELFFHIPLFIATRLSKNGKYAEAMQWFHYIFDPTTNERPEPGRENQRYWQVRPFRIPVPEQIEDILRAINASENPDTEHIAIKDWRDHPFKPHRIAAKRPSAYMLKVVLQYMDNLIAWGDDLFRRDTIESLNEATQLYVLAGHILGRRPEFVPRRGEIQSETYDSLRTQLDDFSNAMVQLENLFPYSSAAYTDSGASSGSLLGIGEAFYFCIPNNDKLLKYWDTVADRLFKIRHCQNIEGTFRKLALFEPPIDPALLVQAAAAGLSISDVLNDTGTSFYRFQYLLQKANELCSEVKGLGAALLSAIEKKESEQLSRLRAIHEANLLQMISGIKERQVLEAKTNLQSTKKSRETALQRLHHYLELLGEELISPAEVEALPAEVDRDFTIPETVITPFRPNVDVRLVDGGERGVKLIPLEKQDLDKSSEAHAFQLSAASLEALAGILHLIPDFAFMGAPFGVGTKVNWGGQHIGAATSAVAKVYNIVSSQMAFDAGRAAKMGSFVRRDQDWVMQANMAAREIIQLDKQVVAGQIRIQIAEKELLNHQQQIENARETEAFLYSKFANQELYQWMKEELLGLHRQSYNLAFDLARKAEAAYLDELGLERDPARDIINYGYWNTGYEGLLSGEQLQFALRQLEIAYMEANKRAFEITKHISLNMLNPFALLQLRENGFCDFSIPEEIFDLDFPGHYYRRIKSVSISIPCVAGPYTTINATLRLQSSSTRINTVAGSQYARTGELDERFQSALAGVLSIATSSAQNDSGLFELNLRDERYLPFENAGAISTWRLEMMDEKSLRQFDYNTISDVVIHLRYTARENSDLKSAAIGHLNDITTQLGAVPLQRLFSLRHDFPNEWHVWQRQGQPLAVKLEKHHFPYWAQLGEIDVVAVTAYAKNNGQIHLDGPRNFTFEMHLTNQTWNIIPPDNFVPENDDWFVLVAYQLG